MLLGQLVPAAQVWHMAVGGGLVPAVQQLSEVVASPMGLGW